MTEKMRVASTYLTQKHYNNGILIALAVLTTCFVFSQLHWTHGTNATSPFSASPETVLKNKEYWRLFTSVFVHADLKHLLSNSLMLTFMGYFVASYYGPLVFPFSSIAIGGLINLLVVLSYEREINIVGISGVVYYLWGFWLILYILIQRHIPLNRRLMKVVAISLILLIPTTYEPQVSYKAHGLGFLFGLLQGTATYIFRRSKFLSYEKLEPLPEEWLQEENDVTPFLDDEEES